MTGMGSGILPTWERRLHFLKVSESPLSSCQQLNAFVLTQVGVCDSWLTFDLITKAPTAISKFCQHVHLLVEATENLNTPTWNQRPCCYHRNPERIGSWRTWGLRSRRGGEALGLGAVGHRNGPFLKCWLGHSGSGMIWVLGLVSAKA